MIILNIIEAHHDFYVIDEVATKSLDSRDKWHLYSALYFVVLLLGITFMMTQEYNTYQIIMMFIFSVITRGVVFNSLLNKLRKRDWWYRGTGKFDTMILKIFRTEKILWWSLNIVFLIVIVLTQFLNESNH